jgi:ERCC4-type nuclease
MAAKRVTRKKGGPSDIFLVADTRERSVVPFLSAELRGYAHVLKQINTADYLVCRRAGSNEKTVVLAAIERKTLPDFAASFKDGRYGNVDKMLALRRETGCQLYFFVEGQAFPAPDKRYERIPYANILAAITKLMVRHGIFVVQTADETHTAKRLADFLDVFDVEEPWAPVPGEDAFERGDSVGSFAKRPAPETKRGGAAPEQRQKHPNAPRLSDSEPETEPAVQGSVSDDEPAPEDAPEDEPAPEDELDAPGEPLGVPDALTRRLEQTDSEAAVMMWSQLRGVSVVLGKILTRTFSVAQLVGAEEGTNVPTRLSDMRTATGRRINKDAVASLTAIRASEQEASVKLLSGLRNVTKAVAQTVLNAVGGLRALCKAAVTAVAAIQIQQKTRTVRLGLMRAERIRRLLHYCEPAVGAPREAAAPSEPAPTAAVQRTPRAQPAAARPSSAESRKPARALAAPCAETGCAKQTWPTNETAVATAAVSGHASRAAPPMAQTETQAQAQHSSGAISGPALGALAAQLADADLDMLLADYLS